MKFYDPKFNVGVDMDKNYLFIYFLNYVIFIYCRLIQRHKSMSSVWDWESV